MASIKKLINISAFGPYCYLIKMAALSLLLMTISRIGLVAWQFERVNSAGSVVEVVIQGLRADFIMVCLWLVIPVLLAPLSGYRKFNTLWFKFTYGWSLIGIIVILFMELATPAFLLQFDVRPNRLFIEYLQYPKEVFSTLWNGFRAPFLSGIFLTVTIGYLIYRTLQIPFEQQVSWPIWKTLLLWPVVILIVFVGIRSTTDHRPANPAFFALTGDSMVNSLIISSSYSVAYALYSMRHEARSSEIYGKLPYDEMIEHNLNWPWLKTYKFLNLDYPTNHYQEAQVQHAKPLNLVIILQESMGATFVESLGGLPVTPELEKLKSEGIWFKRLYATGTRSVRGIEAVVAGYLPTPAQSVVKLSNSQYNFATIGSILSGAGYETQFVYGGEAHFDNMRSFFTNNGFKDIVDLPRIKNPAFVGSWGASDEDLFSTAFKEIKSLNDAKKPFFSLIFTSSNHEPFEFPDGRIELYDTPKNSVNNAVKYADWSMGKFIEAAKKSDLWKDTVFLIVADHDNRVYGNNLIPIEKFQIPGLILGETIQPAEIEHIASQVDLAPTLLSLIGVSACHPLIGRDFMQDKVSPGRAIMQFDDYFALMRPENIVILKPNENAAIAKYDEKLKKLVLLEDKVTEADREIALAHVQLPSYLYRERKYSSISSCNR